MECCRHLWKVDGIELTEPFIEALFNKLPEKSRCVLFQRLLTIVYVAQDAEHHCPQNKATSERSISWLRPARLHEISLRLVFVGRRTLVPGAVHLSPHFLRDIGSLTGCFRCGCSGAGWHSTAGKALRFGQTIDPQTSVLGQLFPVRVHWR